MLTNTFGLASCGRRLFLPGRLGLGVHQPKVWLSVIAANIGLCKGIGQYHRLIDSSPSFWLNCNCPQRLRRNWVAFVGRAGEACSESAWMIPCGGGRTHSTLKEQMNVELLGFFRGASSDA